MISSQTLGQPTMHFITINPMTHSRHVNVGPNQTDIYSGTGLGMTFSVRGTNPYGDHYANAHLDLTLGHLGFVGEVDLGHFADVTVQGMSAVSYTYIGDHLRLYSAANTLINELTIKATDPISVASVPAMPGYPSALIISTGSFSLGEGAAYAIYPNHAA